MPSPRATLSKSALDRTVATEADNARRAVERALRACKIAQKGQDYPRGRVARVIRELNKARNSLNNISRVTPGWDPTDPDLMDEDTRAEQWRAERAQREKERLEAEQAERDRLEAEIEAELEEGS